MAAKDTHLGFGFAPWETAHHFLVTIPRGATQDVLIAEHFTFDADKPPAAPSLADDRTDAKLRVVLSRPKWDAIADPVRVELNQRLKARGIAPGRWKTGGVHLSRLLGKELTLLAWAIEDADPAVVPNALKNWQGLAPEERWWLYTMTAAATGHAVYGRNKGWRKAVRFALTENPVSGDSPAAHREAFRLVIQDAAVDA
jgi:hypothetical protein